jgi:hypothetical protein
MGIEPLFERVTVFAVLVVPTISVPNASDLEDTAGAGTRAMPVTLDVRVIAPELTITEALWRDALVEIGLNITFIVQLAPMAKMRLQLFV